MARRVFQRVWHSAWWLAVAIAFGYVVYQFIPTHVVMWDYRSGKPTPDTFEYLMYPINSSVELLDPVTGATRGTLDRAVLATEGELREKTVRVSHPAGDAVAQRFDLTVFPPPHREELLRAKWLKWWGGSGSVNGADGGYTYAQYRRDDITTECRLTIHRKGHIKDVTSVWLLSSSDFMPLRVEVRDSNVSFFVACASGFVGVVGSLCARIWCKRRGIFPYKNRLMTPSVSRADGVES